MQAILAALKAVAEPTRLRLLALCARGELTVSELTRILGQSQPRVSRHLKVLLDAGLLDRFREQNWVYYRVPLKDPGSSLARQLLALMPKGDPILTLDGLRLDQLLSERVAALESANGEAAERVNGLAVVDRRILGALGDEPVGDLLDIGTGSGRMLRLLADRTEMAVGIDISRDMLLLARSNLRSAGMDHLTVRQGNMYQLKFANEAFHTVTVDQVLFQAEDPESVLAEAARVIKPGGRLLLVEYLTGQADSPRPGRVSGRPITESGLSEWLAAAGFRQETSDRIPANPWPLVLMVSRRRHAAGAAAA
jgi:ArsR family transcriptional regulator